MPPEKGINMCFWIFTILMIVVFIIIGVLVASFTKNGDLFFVTEIVFSLVVLWLFYSNCSVVDDTHSFDQYEISGIREIHDINLNTYEYEFANHENNMITLSSGYGKEGRQNDGNRYYIECIDNNNTPYYTVEKSYCKKRWGFLYTSSANMKIIYYLPTDIYNNLVYPNQEVKDIEYLTENNG